jgi:hypothetical protein
LRKGLGALSPEHGEIVHYGEKSKQEVAENRRIPETAVKRRLFLCAQEIGRAAEDSRPTMRLAVMAISKKMLEQEPDEIEMLLPWHAAGTLNVRDARRLEDALARDPELARLYAVVQEEYAEAIHFNESLGAPSARTMEKLFAAIDREPAHNPSASLNLCARISEFFAKLPPRKA